MYAEKSTRNIILIVSFHQFAIYLTNANRNDIIPVHNTTIYVYMSGDLTIIAQTYKLIS